MPGSKLFVGQRKDPFVVNLGETFDLVNILHPLSITPADHFESAEPDTLADKNITSLILEVPAACLVSDTKHPVIAGWTTASLPAAVILNQAPSAASQPKFGSSDAELETGDYGGAVRSYASMIALRADLYSYRRLPCRPQARDR